MTQAIKSNTGVMHSLISLGTYDGQTCCVDNFIDDYGITEDFDEGCIDYLPEEYWEAFDNSKYMDELQRLANDFIQEEIAPSVLALDIGIKSIKGVGTWSPKEYNFATDELILEIEVEDDFQETVIELIRNLEGEELSSYEKYLKRHCTSYDGFSSFVSNEIPDIIDEIQRDINATELDCFIDWYVEYHCNEDWDEPWMNYLLESIYRSEFLPEDFEPYSRKMVEKFTPLVSQLVKSMYEEYLDIKTATERVLETSDLDPEEDALLYGADSWAINQFISRLILETWKPLDKERLPEFTAIARAKAQSMKAFNVPISTAKEQIRFELSTEQPRPLTWESWELLRFVSAIVDAEYEEPEDDEEDSKDDEE